ncbi:uncharacterized protein LOC110759642 [Prunus avium]|uniref:Uncharacterized protein LOC110759642 n=1 Tax=Prunus avium TaxID=42229 RepID=A0A6P5SUX7_PRUAV|nr:uncharacterized protein LOC110759642 [Prunus avium]
MEQLNVNKNTSSSSSEDSNPCPICLGPIIQDSYLDKCFHKFCYNCILRWTKVVAHKQSCLPTSVKCPLCKTENLSIIHGYDGSSFQKHYINQDSGFILSKDHKYRLQCYYTEPGFLNDIFDVLRYWKSHKYLQPNRWLQSWLRREIQALMQEEDVDIIMHHIHGLIHSSLTRHEQKGQTKTPEAKQREFQESISDAARPFLAARTDRFVNEVELFLASGLNIEAYDAVCMQRLGWSAPGVTTEPTEGELAENRPVIPYLYIFYDSDCSD